MNRRRSCLALLASCIALGSAVATATPRTVTAEGIGDTGNSHPMRFERFGLDQGLSQQNITFIAQDPAGFLWFATEDGLNRYDGYGFEHVRHDRARADSLPSSWVGSVAFDNGGRLWVATDGGGVAWQDPNTGRFTAIASEYISRARALYFDSAGILWIGTRESGVVSYDPIHHTLKRFRTTPNPEIDSIYAFAEDGPSGLWIGTGSGLRYLNRTTGLVEDHQLHLESAGTRAQVHALLLEPDGSVWVGTNQGLERFNPNTGAGQTFRHVQRMPHSLPSMAVSSLLHDSGGRLWVGTDSGLALLDREHGDFETYRFDATDPDSLPDDHIGALFEDRGGLLWVGTKAGVGKWSPRTWSFGHRAAAANEPAGSRYVNAFAEDDTGRLWIATFGAGIAVVDPISGATRRLRHIEGKADGLPDDRVMALLADPEGIVWAGTMSGGLCRIDTRTLQVESYRHVDGDPRSLPAAGVMSLFEDSQRRLWIGTYGGGLARFDRASGSFASYPGVGDRVTALAEDSFGRIWAGTDGMGVSVLDVTSGVLTQLRHGPDSRALSGDTVYAIHVDGTGGIWIGTRDGGVDRAGATHDLSAIHFSTVSESNGLPNNTVYGIEEDSNGHVWVSTNHGLGRIDIRTNAVRSFHRMQGLQAEEFNFGAHLRTRSGQLLFGGSHGFNLFDPMRLRFNEVPPRVVLTKLLKLNSPAPPASLYDPMRSLHLGYRDDVVTFEFAALDFESPAANRFQYQLEGFDPEWQLAGTRRTLTYTGLASGTYTLRVRAANADGTWNPRAWSLPISVDPPPWKSWWARCIYAVLLLLAVYAAWLAHRRSLQRASAYRQQLEQEVRDRTQELAQRNTQLEESYNKLEEVNSRLEEVSLTDALTGLGNRRSLHQAMPRLLAAAEASNSSGARGPYRLILMVVDLDRLKPINDGHGHEAGDHVLSQLSEVLADCVRETDKVVRWGGDEFVIACQARSLQDAAVLAERIRSTVARKRFQINGRQVERTSVSIGFACYPFVAEAPQLIPWEGVLNLADAALYRAKSSRNAWVGWSGRPAAADLTDLLGRVESDPRAAELDDYIESCTSQPVSDETVELLLRQSGRRG
ncbi:MAG TPA: two-component regulator propeller domain-containing protein [Steroidobacteraceae bacterium]|jgi:diguanylate cyclase (GGDEF)-like protein